MKILKVGEGKQRSVYFIAPFIRDKASKSHCSDIKSIVSNEVIAHV